MLSFYKNLPIAAKLFLSNLVFALPMAVLIFLWTSASPATSNKIQALHNEARHGEL